MFKYTIKPHIRYALLKYRTGYHGDASRQYISTTLQTVGVNDYQRRNAFYEAPEVEFYSRKPVRHVPICGFLYPVALFTEETIG